MRIITHKENCNVKFNRTNEVVSPPILSKDVAFNEVTDEIFRRIQKKYSKEAHCTRWAISPCRFSRNRDLHTNDLQMAP